MKSEIRLLGAGLLLLLLIAASCQQQAIASALERGADVGIHSLE